MRVTSSYSRLSLSSAGIKTLSVHAVKKLQDAWDACLCGHRTDVWRNLEDYVWRPGRNARQVSVSSNGEFADVQASANVRWVGPCHFESDPMGDMAVGGILSMNVDLHHAVHYFPGCTYYNCGNLRQFVMG